MSSKSEQPELDTDEMNMESEPETEEMNLITAVNRALRQEMSRIESVRLLGYDIGPLGGVYRGTEGLLEEFGGERVIDTPLSENGIIGTAAGMAMRGERPVPEIQFLGFSTPPSVSSCTQS